MAKLLSLWTISLWVGLTAIHCDKDGQAPHQDALASDTDPANPKESEAEADAGNDIEPAGATTEDNESLETSQCMQTHCLQPLLTCRRGKIPASFIIQKAGGQ